MRFTLKIDMDNAAFESHPSDELTRILRVVANSVNDLSLGNRHTTRVRDGNGNTVGEWKVTQ